MAPRSLWVWDRAVFLFGKDHFSQYESVRSGDFIQVSACCLYQAEKGDGRDMAGKKKEAAEKTLDKMTVKELREVAKELPEITGVHGMNKGELYSAILKARGVEEKPKKKKVDRTLKGIKQKIKTLKKDRENALGKKDQKMAKIYRRQISRLKKRSRRAA